MSKLKKGWLKISIVAIIGALVLAYVLLAYLYKFIAPEEIELMGAVLQPLNVYEGIMADENLRVIVPFLPFLLIAGALYLLRESIFDLKYDDASKFGVKGSAKWGNPLAIMDGKVLAEKTKYGDLEKSMALPEGIILGVAENAKNTLILHNKSNLSTKNVFVNGSSGAGKGQAYVLPNLINNRNESMIVVDPKGENYALTSQLKRDQGYKVYLVDFRNFEFARYNPLDYVKNDEDAQKVSKIISMNSVGDGKEDFFTERAQKLLAGLISFVKTEYPDDQANMATLIEVYTKNVADAAKCERWLYNMSDEQPAKQLLVSVLADLTSENTRSSVTSSFQSAISIFQLNRVRKMTLVSDFSFDDFPKEKSVVYVKISAPSNPYKPLTSVFFSQMIERFFEIGDQDPLGRLKTPVHFLLDEFPNIGKIDSYQETLALCRGYRIYMHTIVQDVSQLEQRILYGKEVTKAILANHSAKLILKVGEKDSAKYWSEWFGKTTISYKSVSSSQSKSGKTTSTSKQFEQKELLASTDLLKMDDETAYLLLNGHEPLKINKAWQYKLYPNLLADANREPNYLNIRHSLGFTEKPVDDLYNISDDDSLNSFRKYRNRNDGTIESLVKDIEPEEMNEAEEISKAEDMIAKVADKIIETELYENIVVDFHESYSGNEVPTERENDIEYGPPISVEEHDELAKAFSDEESEEETEVLSEDDNDFVEVDAPAESSSIDENEKDSADQPDNIEEKEEVEDGFSNLLSFDVEEEPEEEPEEGSEEGSEEEKKNDKKTDTEDSPEDLLKLLEM